MKRSSKLLAINALAAVCLSLLTSCSIFGFGYSDNENYQEKLLNVYREKDKVNTKFKVRFYENTPHIPYVNVIDYYKEFFAHNDYRLIRDDSVYELKSPSGAFIRMDAKNNILTLRSMEDFGDHAESIRSTGRSFVKVKKVTNNGYLDKVIALDNYHIDIHSQNGAVFMPLSFLSNFSGSSWFYNVTYNGKDIYVLDRAGVLTPGISRDTAYYGESYAAPLRDFETRRPQDEIDYTYGQLCCAFDQFRGYTSQLSFGDNNLLSLGTNGLLEEYYPKIKELLLSSGKKEYYAGYNLLMGGMFDGGHTATLMPRDDEDFGMNSPAKYLDSEKYADELALYEKWFFSPIKEKGLTKSLFTQAKAAALPYVPATSESEGQNNYYYYDEATKTAIIGFDSFSVDNVAWDEFYKNKKSPEEAPVNTDAFAYIRSKFYQAKEDGAKNLALDISTNGGGNTLALIGIMSLFNKGTGFMSMNDTANHLRNTMYCDVDINLDGVWDEKDQQEAESFDFNFGVITSSISFSCANLLPSLLQELGVKIIGSRSGGGSCSVVSNSTTDGLYFAHSSWLCLSNANGENIDSGVPVDKELPLSYMETQGVTVANPENFYDIAGIGNYLTTAF